MDHLLVGGLEPWNFMTFHILGMSSSQLTFIFFRGVETTNQKNYGCFEGPTTNHQSSQLTNSYFSEGLGSTTNRPKNAMFFGELHPSKIPGRQEELLEDISNPSNWLRDASRSWVFSSTSVGFYQQKMVISWCFHGMLDGFLVCVFSRERLSAGFFQ